MIEPDVVLIGCRLLFDGAALFLWGSSAYLAALVPARLARDVERRLRGTQRLAIAFVGLAVLALLPLQAANIGDGWGDASRPDMLLSVLMETGVGKAWIATAIAALLLFAAALAPMATRQKAIAASSALLLATLSLTGHAAMNPGWLGLVHRINDVLHLLAAGGWLGALIPVLLILPQINRPDPDGEARRALLHFSNAGHAAVAFVVLTGLANIYLVIGHLPVDWSVLYQPLLTLKIAIVATIVALAVVNRYTFVPSLARGNARALVYLYRGTMAEIVLGIIVIATVAWFGTLDPA